MFWNQSAVKCGQSSGWEGEQWELWTVCAPRWPGQPPVPWGGEEPTPRPVPSSSNPLQLCDLGKSSVLSFPACDGTWSFLPPRSSSSWEGERGPQRGGCSGLGPRERSSLPCLVIIRLPLSPDGDPPEFPAPHPPRPAPRCSSAPKRQTHHEFGQAEGRPSGQAQALMLTASPALPAEEASSHGSFHHDGRELQGAGP